MGECFSFCAAGDGVGSNEPSNFDSDFPLARDFRSNDLASSRKAGLGFDKSTCVSGMCRTVHEFSSTPMASKGIMSE